MNEAYCQLFLRETRHGILAGVKLPPPTDDLHVSPLLTEKEKEHVLWLPVLRRAAWMGGRVALRLAARHFGIELDSVFSTHRGAPSLPPGQNWTDHDPKLHASFFGPRSPIASKTFPMRNAGPPSSPPSRSKNRSSKPSIQSSSATWAFMKQRSKFSPTEILTSRCISTLCTPLSRSMVDGRSSTHTW